MLADVTYLFLFSMLASTWLDGCEFWSYTFLCSNLQILSTHMHWQPDCKTFLARLHVLLWFSRLSFSLTALPNIFMTEIKIQLLSPQTVTPIQLTSWQDIPSVPFSHPPWDKLSAMANHDKFTIGICLWVKCSAHPPQIICWISISQWNNLGNQCTIRAGISTFSIRHSSHQSFH